MNTSAFPLRLDPRAAILLLVIANVIAFTYRLPWIELVTICLLALLQLCCGCGKSAMRWLLFFGLLVAFQYFILPILPKILAVIFTILTVFARKIVPCLMMGSLIIQTIPVRALIVALRKWRIPQSVIIPLAVTLRYFPAIREEHRHIRDAMKLKQLHGFSQKLECTMVPLLVSAVKTSDELSAAAITRGIENPGEKTCILDLRFHWQDVLCLLIGALIALCSVCLS